MSVDDARRVIERAAAARVFPAAAVEVGSSSDVLWTEAFGTLTFDAAASMTSIDTPFDLASLTKVISTTSTLMELTRTGALDLDERVSACFAEWRGRDRDHVTIRHLLEHASGLPARLIDAPPIGRREFEHEICVMPLEYAPASASVYSDLGFILLGFLACDRGSAPLTELFLRIAGTNLTFGLAAGNRKRAAPTRPMDDDGRRGRLLQGEVHDNYAAALGGVAGHAGLFGSAPAVGLFARTVLRAARGGTDQPAPFVPALVKAFTARGSVTASSRALGWDTMLPTSSCGQRMTQAAFGHVGFTGTSLWIDPLRDRYFVLLTNRACGGGTLDEIRAVRRDFHDALGDL
ncbi:MAG TPA: serine hydrolase [Vicinamibacterales bacterium]